MVTDISNAIHGPPPKGVIPTFSTNNHKGLPGGNEHVTYPGAYHYLAGAILESAKLVHHSQRLSWIAHSRSPADNAAGQCQNSFGHSGDRMHQARTPADSNSSSGRHHGVPRRQQGAFAWIPEINVAIRGRPKRENRRSFASGFRAQNSLLHRVSDCTGNGRFANDDERSGPTMA